jgi:hypothetical protein
MNNAACLLNIYFGTTSAASASGYTEQIRRFYNFGFTAGSSVRLFLHIRGGMPGNHSKSE